MGRKISMDALGRVSFVASDSLGYGGTVRAREQRVTPSLQFEGIEKCESRGM